jgi:hypothetical protein
MWRSVCICAVFAVMGVTACVEIQQVFSMVLHGRGTLMNVFLIGAHHWYSFAAVSVCSTKSLHH